MANRRTFQRAPHREATSGMGQERTHRPGRPAVAAADNLYLLFAAGALVAAFLGLLLALLLPLAMLVDWHWGLRWVALAQAHGHVQVMGWAGLFILGMGYRLVPRFSSAPLRGRTLVVPSFALLTLALLLRLVLQPFGDHDGARQVLPLAGLAELAAVTIFAGLTLPLLRRPLREGVGFAPYFVALALWLMVQAALATVWLWDIARAGTPVLPGTRNEVLLAIQFFGVLLTAISGVSLRTLPIFFQQPLPDLRAVWPRFALLQGGLALYVIVMVGSAYAPHEALRILHQQRSLLSPPGW